MKNNVQKFAWLMVLATSSGVMVGMEARVAKPMEKTGVGTQYKEQKSLRENLRQAYNEKLPNISGRLAEVTGYNPQAHKIKRLNEAENFKAKDLIESDGLALTESSPINESNNTAQATQLNPGWNFRTAAVNTGRGINFAVQNPITTASSAASGIYQGGKSAVSAAGRGINFAGQATQIVGRTGLSGARRLGTGLGIGNITGNSMEMSLLSKQQQDAIQNRFNSKIKDSKYESVSNEFITNENGLTQIETNNLGDKLVTIRTEDGANIISQKYIPRDTRLNYLGRKVGQAGSFVGRQISSGATHAYNAMPSWRRSSTTPDATTNLESDGQPLLNETTNSERGGQSLSTEEDGHL